MKDWRHTSHRIDADWEDQEYHKGKCPCGLLIISGTVNGLKAKVRDHRGTELASGKQKPPD